MPKTQTITPITNLIALKINSFCDNPRLANIAITLMADSYAEEGVFYPSTSVTVYGSAALKKLRDEINKLQQD